MIDLASLTLSDASRLLADGAVSAVELTEATLARIEATEPHVHAYVHVCAERALADAAAADERRARDRARGTSTPALCGIPFGVKDVLDTAGVPTAAGSRLLAGRVPREDAEAVARLRERGAVLVGKHHTHEFACGQDTPPSRNPWNLEHYSGGSSAGGGVSVEVGSSLLALGTDAGGSVRKPAAVTGTVGLKPTHGAVSGHGTVRAASAPSLDHVGTFTRSAADARVVLEALWGADARDPRTGPVGSAGALLGGDAPGGLRLGVAPATLGGDLVRADVRAVYERALGELEALGATLVEVELPSFATLPLPACFAILLHEVASVHREWLADRPDEYVRETRLVLEQGAILPAAYVHGANRARARLTAEARAAFEHGRLHALVTPTLPITSMPLAEMDTGRDLPALIPFTCPWNLTGQPALSVPCGLTDAGLPVGLQLVGRPLEDPILLAIAERYQHETSWHRQRAVLPA